MAQRALPPGAIRRRAVFGLLDADGWTWAGLKATFWFLFIVFMLGYIPNLAYYFTVQNTVEVGYNFISIVNWCPEDNQDLPCPAPTGATLPWQASPPELALPSARAGSGIFQSGTNLYLIGGETADGRHRRGPRDRRDARRQLRAVDRGPGAAGAARPMLPSACTSASRSSWAGSMPPDSRPTPSSRASSRKAQLTGWELADGNEGTDPLTLPAADQPGGGRDRHERLRAHRRPRRVGRAGRRRPRRLDGRRRVDRGPPAGVAGARGRAAAGAASRRRRRHRRRVRLRHRRHGPGRRDRLGVPSRARRPGACDRRDRRDRRAGPSRRRSRACRSRARRRSRSRRVGHDLRHRRARCATARRRRRTCGSCPTPRPATSRTAGDASTRPTCRSPIARAPVVGVALDGLHHRRRDGQRPERWTRCARASRRARRSSSSGSRARRSRPCRSRARSASSSAT